LPHHSKIPAEQKLMVQIQKVAVTQVGLVPLFQIIKPAASSSSCIFPVQEMRKELDGNCTEADENDEKNGNDKSTCNSEITIARLVIIIFCFLQRRYQCLPPPLHLLPCKGISFFVHFLCIFNKHFFLLFIK
jgi:hypothetical protein